MQINKGMHVYISNPKNANELIQFYFYISRDYNPILREITASFFIFVLASSCYLTSPLHKIT